MGIIQGPGQTCFAGNIAEIIADGLSGPTLVTLTVDGNAELFREYYYPVDGKIHIDIAEVVIEALGTEIPAADNLLTIQPRTVRPFLLRAGNFQHNFTAVGGGIDAPGDNAAAFLEANFLTATLPREVTPGSLRYLTYYVQETCTLEIQIDTGSGLRQFSQPLAYGKCYTFNISPAFLRETYRLDLHSLRVWIEAASGYRLAETSYRVADSLDGAEEYPFVNSLGGIDTLVCTGQYSLSHRVENTLGLRKKKREETGQGLTIACKQNTGYLSADGIALVRDFIQSRQKYHLCDGRLLPIVIEDQENEYVRFGLNYFEFEYQYSRTMPYRRVQANTVSGQLPPFYDKVAACFDKRVGTTLVDRIHGYVATVSAAKVTFPQITPDVLNKRSGYWTGSPAGGRAWEMAELRGVFTINYATDDCTRILFFRDTAADIYSAMPVIVYSQPLTDAEIEQVLRYLNEYYFLEDREDKRLLVANEPEEDNNLFVTDNSTLK